MAFLGNVCVAIACRQVVAELELMCSMLVD